jgi:hypothetical protein
VFDYDNAFYRHLDFHLSDDPILLPRPISSHIYIFLPFFDRFPMCYSDVRVLHACQECRLLLGTKIFCLESAMSLPRSNSVTNSAFSLSHLPREIE